MGSVPLEDSYIPDIAGSAKNMRQDSHGGTSSALNSWKEIAGYLGRGVRTVQRWERNCGLPVHRPKSPGRSATLALPSELDEWLRATPVRSGPDGHSGGGRLRNGANGDDKPGLLRTRERISQIGDAPVGFVRKLLTVESRYIIHSRCKYCGLLIVVSLVESLAAEERRHRRRCSKAS